MSGEHIATKLLGIYDEIINPLITQTAIDAA